MPPTKQTHTSPPREFTPIISRLSNLGQILARLVKMPKFYSKFRAKFYFFIFEYIPPKKSF